MEQEVTLGGLAGGGAAELWDAELKKCIENILDVNTDPKAKRELSLKLTMLPNEDRNNAAVAVEVTSKLPGLKPTSTVIYFAKKGGKVIVVESDPKQMSLLAQEEPTKLTPVKGGKEH